MCISSTRLTKEEMEFCYQYLKDRGDYHHHKERMAFLGLGVQIAFFAGFMTTDKLPKLMGLIEWEVAAEYILVLIVFILWLFMHAFVRWQLIMRRDAAFHVLVLRDLILERLAGEAWKGKACKKDGGNGQSYGCLRLCFNYLFPCIKVPEFRKKEACKYPKWYQKKFDECKDCPPAISSEYVIFLGSVCMLALMLVKVTVTLGLCISITIMLVVILGCLFCRCWPMRTSS